MWIHGGLGLTLRRVKPGPGEVALHPSTLVQIIHAWGTHAARTQHTLSTHTEHRTPIARASARVGAHAHVHRCNLSHRLRRRRCPCQSVDQISLYRATHGHGHGEADPSTAIGNGKRCVTNRDTGLGLGACRSSPRRNHGARRTAQSPHRYRRTRRSPLQYESLAFTGDSASPPDGQTVRALATPTSETETATTAARPRINQYMYI